MKYALFLFRLLIVDRADWTQPPFLQTITTDIDMKTKVENVLKETGYSEERGAKMGVDDLLKCVLLASYFLPDAFFTHPYCQQASVCFP